MSRSGTFTTEFRDEFEAERTRWLRRRFLWWTGTVSVLGTLQVAVSGVFIVLKVPAEAAWHVTLFFAIALAALAVFIGPFVYVKRHRDSFTREGLLRLATWMIVIAGLINLVSIPPQYFLQAYLDPEHASASSSLEMQWIITWMANVLIIHLLASAFIPWTPREAARPLLPLVSTAAAFQIAYSLVVAEIPWWVGFLLAAVLPLIGAPGMLVALWRHSRFRKRFMFNALRGRYTEMKRELVDARRIHEALFPDPVDDGPIRMSYVYEPMRDIGGDFLFARRNPHHAATPTTLDVVILDVTGHGLTAALTVNRLHGEIAREFGESPSASPAEILTGLNAYLHHTLASHSVYATALCIRVDAPNNRVEWASAGHPPAFLRAVDGTIHQLEPTTLVLGAVQGEVFNPEMRSATFAPGDTILAYTDGATEARNAAGRMLRVDGVLAAVATAPEEPAGQGIARHVASVVEAHRDGPTRDDTLLVEIHRPLG